MNRRNKIQDGPTKEQLREGEEGLVRLLAAKRFTREWIERHVPEAMAQAQADLAARIAAGREDETVGLLVVIAYRRALKALTAERTKPRTVPVEEVFDLSDKYARTPEQTVIDADRQARLLRAMRYLPDRDRELLALVYYGELDVKEAGRRLGWTSSSAHRHHNAALAKLRALVGERSLLGVDVAVPALIASGYSLPNRASHHWLEAAADRARELAGWVLQRSSSIAETGSAVGMSGAARTSAGVCGLAVATCMAAVTSGVVGSGVDALHAADPAKPLHRISRPHKPTPAARPERRSAESAARSEQAAGTVESKAVEWQTAAVSKRHAGTNVPKAKQRGSDTRAAPPQAATPSVEEFGVEGGSGEALSQPPDASSSAPPPAGGPPRKPAPSSSGKPEAGSEFEM